MIDESSAFLFDPKEGTPLRDDIEQQMEHSLLCRDLVLPPSFTIDTLESITTTLKRVKAGDFGDSDMFPYVAGFDLIGWVVREEEDGFEPVYVPALRPKKPVHAGVVADFINTFGLCTEEDHSDEAT